MKDWEAAYLAGIIDGEGSITLTRLHKNEYRRPCISISSNDMEMLQYIQKLAGEIFILRKITIHANIKTPLHFISKKSRKYLKSYRRHTPI
ncbi:LAGLIDADG family homing endonuclease [Paracerasibacillus soli]|uniref:LAGLIDADG family homing endonuclease n=1 Tax=Paracerasibacillus soli TaxID=480284 RepID=A0ABU5CR47_9BACI|nr:LAGLIDADG family homing endonuclease [Virgibacillus soli]MDY0408842.1 LAGLIDADG family homing endonuclease [Virgibacillus soli]